MNMSVDQVDSEFQNLHNLKLENCCDPILKGTNWNHFCSTFECMRNAVFLFYFQHISLGIQFSHKYLIY